jgi:predicted nuclease of predicted toxin-antitoxin system
LSLKIYLDDRAYAKELAALLRTAGHEVVTPSEAGTSKKADPIHFAYAASHGLVLLTRDPHDFEQLHQADQAHAGILAIYQDNDPERDMSYGDIVRALGNLEQAGVELRGTFQSLNAWRY